MEAEQRVKMLEEAIRLHKAMVLRNPDKTADAEDMLWALIEDQSAQGK